jgi:histidinol-phosphate aminotransferase
VSTDPLRPTRPIPTYSLASLGAYRPSRAATPVDLHLDGNEGAVPPGSLLEGLLQRSGDLLRRYPNARELEQQLAERYHVPVERVLVTAGGDDAIERACRAMLAPGRELLIASPTFEMFSRFARLAGAQVREVAWPTGPFPTDAILELVDDATGVIAVVSPNNPTGAVATADDLRRLSEAAPHALLIVDLAYVEFADVDLTATALELSNAVVIRSMSKAWGLAGLRVGYALGPAEIVGWMRAAGLPYAVSRPSLAMATAWLREGQDEVTGFVARVRGERQRLTASLNELGVEVYPSQANFVLARFTNGLWVRDALAGLGISVRAFPDRADLEGCLRLTCPGDEAAFARLDRALHTVLAPEALLLDMDGVLVDVSASYRQAILQTAASYGVVLSVDDVREAKRLPEANNDWILTRRLLLAQGVDAPLEQVTARFEEVYQGTPDEPGLRRYDRLTVPRSLLERWRRRARLAIVTGRPRRDAERFLAEAGVADLFEAVVCMEDAPRKPDPAPVRLALQRLGSTRAWMLGDTPDDALAARAAGVLPLGVRAAGESTGEGDDALITAGAGRVLPTLEALEELLP